MMNRAEEDGDLDLAIRTLQSNGSSIVFARDQRIIYQSNGRGVSSYVHALESQREALRQSALADTIAGRAVALLSVYAGIKLAYAETISEGAMEILAYHGIPFAFAKKVPKILNRTKSDQCPIEKLVSDIQDPEAVFLSLTKAFGNGGHVSRPNKGNDSICYLPSE
jgi:hypothetical protein